ncbi:ATP-binding cassette domain-containing protein [Streptococcus danieliae]|uniref:ATP-binding cassette domain-containing protein n=1 Tax=Streptococcus danieliae TaxID=747656 RepID=A0A7Z0M578_9STRE|nr:ATP-binding cassette domain-containing protein [Streptococcus danieliae]MBF0698938.1 ATP-binding cassette domain-containing protein [Streptococcus danieliae]NYS96115.1 ATP-binding cassette domain-containing protein [Streptococcus danieliae]
MIDIQNLHKSYCNRPILEDINLTISQGCFTAFIGPNGAGKSSLLRILCRLDKCNQGRLVLKGQELQAWGSQELAQELTLLQQRLNIQSRLTVHDLVIFGRYPYHQGRPRPEDETRVQEVLDYLDISDLSDRFIDQLSGGQLQRALIGMVLAQDTELILLDEPLNNLDLKQSIAMMDLLRRLVDELGKTIVMVVHDINLASQYVDEMVALKDGHIFHRGPTEEVMLKPILDELYDMDLTLTTVQGRTLCTYRN